MKTSTTHLLTLSLVAGTLTLAGCAHNATTGRNQIVGLSAQQELALGEQAKPELTKEFGGEVKDPALTGYVREIGAKLAAHTEASNPSLPWEFTLLDSKVINAFALPGGKVFISKGLADKMTNEAQLAGVLGHEIGHVCARHTSERVGQQQLIGLGVQLGSVAISRSGAGAGVQEGAGVALNLGGTLVPLKFSRDQESEADSLGMRYMTKAGYNPRAQQQVMEILHREGGAGNTGELLATHPLPQTRIERVGEELRTTYANVVNDPKYTLGEESFRQRYLSRSMSLRLDARETEGAVALDLDRPQTWCAHCGE